MSKHCTDFPMHFITDSVHSVEELYYMYSDKCPTNSANKMWKYDFAVFCQDDDYLKK